MFSEFKEKSFAENAFSELQLFTPGLGPADELLATAVGQSQVPVLIVDVVSASFCLIHCILGNFLCFFVVC